jgi:hypothetical protein
MARNPTAPRYWWHRADQAGRWKPPGISRQPARCRPIVSADQMNISFIHPAALWGWREFPTRAQFPPLSDSARPSRRPRVRAECSGVQGRAGIWSSPVHRIGFPPACAGVLSSPDLHRAGAVRQFTKPEISLSTPRTGFELPSSTDARKDPKSPAGGALAAGPHRPSASQRMRTGVKLTTSGANR